MAMDMQLRLCQLNPGLGDLKGNLDLHLRQIDAASRDGVDLIVFPELSLTGYFLKDQVPDLAMKVDAPPMQRIADRSRDLSIVVGFVEDGENDQLYNSLAFFEDGELLGVHRKVHLVSYGMFDEARDFAAGDEFVVIESRLGRFGMMICEDMWHIGGGYSYFLSGVDAVLVSSASPGRGVSAGDEGLRSVAVWDTLLSAQALMFQCWYGYANRVGWEDGVGFSGHSSAWGPEGRCRARQASFEEGFVDQKLSSATTRRVRLRTPLLRDERPEIVRHSLMQAEHAPMKRSAVRTMQQPKKRIQR